MNIIEAVEAMRNGAKVRKKYWKPNEYITITKENPDLVFHVINDGMFTKIKSYGMDITEINMRDEWEIYEDEPDVKASENKTKRIKELTEIIRKASDELCEIIGE